MDIVRWGIIGCGDVCEVKSGPAFQKASGSALVAVMRRDAGKAANFAKRHHVPRWYSDADQLIDDPEVDAVYIATPPGTHAEYALRVAARRKPCYVEKPMARSYAECCRMNEAFAAANTPLFVAYYRRGFPKFIRARQLIDDARLGTVTGCHYRMTRHHSRYADAGWRIAVTEAGGGLLLDVGSHALDILDFLLGPFTQFGGTARSTGITDVEDRVSLHFQTQRGVIGTANWNFAGCNEEDLIEIVGTEGRLSMSVFGSEPMRLERFEKNDANPIVETFAEPHPQHVHQPLIQTIVDQLLGRGECPSTGESAARTSKVMDAALNSFYGGRSDDFWNRPHNWPGRKS